MSYKLLPCHKLQLTLLSKEEGHRVNKLLNPQRVKQTTDIHTADSIENLMSELYLLCLLSI